MKKKVTVINVKGGLSQISIGTLIEFEEDVEGQGYDDFAIKAIVNGEKIGTVTASPTTTVAGCIQNKELHPELKNGKIEGVVIAHDKVRFRGNNNERTALIVEVNLANKVKKTSAKGGNDMKYTCKVKGNTRMYPGKLDILQDFQNGKSVFVTLSKEEETIVVNYNNKPAGIVDERKSQDTTEFNKVVDVLAVMGNMTAKVSNAGGASYVVEFEVDDKSIKNAKTGKKVMSLDEVKSNIVSQGICSAEELDEIQAYLEENDITRKHIIGIFSTYRKYDAKYQGRIPKRPKTVFKKYDNFNAVKKAVIYVLRRKFLRFVGEKGTGKNNLIETLAWVFQRPLYEVSLNRDFDKLDMVGSKTLSVEGDYAEILEPTVVEKGLIGWMKSLVTIIKDVSNTFLRKTTKVTFDKEALIEAMEIGAIINYDEVNTADPALLVMLHSIADSRRTIQVAGYGKVVADENFNIILTMNKDYQGTVSLNEATRDRFTTIKFPCRSSIIDLLQHIFPNADGESLSICDQLYKGILDHIKDGELSMDCLTVRGFIDALDVEEDFGSNGLEEALKDNVANRIEDEEYCDKVLDMIDTLVA